MKRLLLSLLKPVRLLEVRHPHGHLAVGGRTAVIVKAAGFGSIGRGADLQVVDGAFDGVVFVDVIDNHAVVAARGLLVRRRQLVPVTPVALPAMPSSPRPLPPPHLAVTVPVVALPVCTVCVDVSFEVP